MSGFTIGSGNSPLALRRTDGPGWFGSGNAPLDRGGITFGGGNGPVDRDVRGTVRRGGGMYGGGLSARSAR